jgi:hypothetical protein
MATVTFDPEKFKQSYPQFKDVPDATLNGNFALAETALDNTDKSSVKDPKERETLLYLLVAHISQLYAVNGGGAVGAIASASQGKVSTSFALPGGMNWYKQSQWGYLFWQLTAKYRLGGRYFAYRRGRRLP